jgi:hypothetical protein
MNRNENTELTVETLLALRSQENAAQLIAEKLRVKEMGPADHIRTKHEVKAFVESGDIVAAQNLLKNATNRVTAGVTVTIQADLKQSVGRRLS